MSVHEIVIREHAITGTAYISMDDIPPTPICRECVDKIMNGMPPSSIGCSKCMKLMKSEYRAMRRWQREQKVS
jgi:hypothetical protein